MATHANSASATHFAILHPLIRRRGAPGSRGVRCGSVGSRGPRRPVRWIS